jgi:DNA-binding transcriptional LysR family regulator
MGQLVVEFMNKFTDISLSVTHYSGVLPSNVHDFDLSFVVHDRPMPASDLIAKTLMSLPQGIYGSPHGCGYQSAIELDEIIDHCTILPLQEHDWHFRRGKESISVPVSARLTMSSESMRVTAALNGAGIVKLPCYIAEKYVRQGALSQIKTPLPLAAQTVSVVYPSRVIPRKTRILLDFIQENIGKLYSPV